MSLLVTGQLDRIIEREAGSPGNTWTERTLVVQDWGVTLYLTVAREFGDLPAQGENLALNVMLRPYPKKDGTPAVGMTALSRNSEVETALGFRRNTSPAPAPAGI